VYKKLGGFRYFEVEMAVEKLKRHKPLAIDQSAAALIKARDRAIQSEIHKLIISVWNKEEVREEWKESIIVLIYKKGDKTGSSNCRGILLLSTTYRSLANIHLSRLTPYAEEIIVDHQCRLRRGIIYSAFVKYLTKNGNTMRQCISYL
jgi:hypothetical protein